MPHVISPPFLFVMNTEIRIYQVVGVQNLIVALFILFTRWVL